MHAASLLLGLGAFSITRKTPKYSYFSFRHLFCLSNGRINDAAGAVSTLVHHPYEIQSVEGVLGKLDASQLSAIVHHLRRDGFYIFEKRLDAAVCNELTE